MIFRRMLAALAALFVLCLVSCVPVVYEIKVPADVYGKLHEEPSYKMEYVSGLYGQNTVKELFSCEKYSVVALDASAEDTSTKPRNVFALAEVYYERKKSKALVAAGLPQHPAAHGDKEADFSEETSRTYLYPCVPFYEDMIHSEFVLPGSWSDSEETAVSASLPDNVLFYSLSDIPLGYVALPVRYGDAVYRADDFENPFFDSTFLNCTLFPVPDVPRQAVRNHYDEAASFCENLFKNEIAPEFKTEPVLPDVFFVAAVGDIILSRGVQETMIYAKSSVPVFNDTVPVLKNNDFTIGNLEGAVTARTDNTQKTYTFKFKKAALPYLKDVGFDYLMLTNNHCYDYGEAGFKDTLEAVAAAGFATSGAGLNDEEAAQFYRTQIKGHDVSVLSFGAYPVERSGFDGKKMAAATGERAGILWESDEVLDLIREEKKKGAIIIVNIHGGSEYVTSPTTSQRNLYEKVCDAGADVVFGSHPHVLQPVEWYNDSLIVWSLGNFVFPGMEDMPGATDTMIIRIGFVNGRLLYYEKYPAYIDGTAVHLK